MYTQHQIKRTLSDPTSIEQVCELLTSHSNATRARLATLVCERFGFYNALGKAQNSSCLKALRDLEAAGHFTLPAARKRKYVPWSPVRLSEAVPLPVDVPSQVTEVEDLKLVQVNTVEQRQIWNELMIREHPLKVSRQVGPQLRYLIYSSHGWLGGFEFAAAARHLADRDEWIGWNIEQRKEKLNVIVGMTRFLLRPSVRCKNLASKTLGMCVTSLPRDFELRYGYRPLLLESFVDISQYSGTCYQAANWIEVGKTKGRGRQDSSRKSKVGVKAIYMYPVEGDFREQLGVREKSALKAITLEEGLDTDCWAENEFGGAQLGDTRLDKRLVGIAAAQAEMPGSSYSSVAKGDWAATKAYYRLIDKPEESEVKMSNILAPHRKRTIQRMMNEDVVLSIQDGTDLNYSGLDQCKGLGVVGANQTKTKSRGLHLHSTLAVTTSGLPLGILRADCRIPVVRSPEDRRHRRAIPIEDKQNFSWIEHHRDAIEIASLMPQTQIISVCDREADFFEYFEEQRQDPRVDLLVRAQHNRNTPEGKLFEVVHQERVRSRVQVTVPRQSARPKKGSQAARVKKDRRIATMAIRYKRIQLPRPAYVTDDRRPIDIWVVSAQEENQPEGTEPLQWILLTTLNINSVQDAEKCLKLYCIRWRIEDWHRVLKSGCRIEELAHKTAERLRRAIAIKLVLAWRIMLMTLLGREVPGLPAEILFSDIELCVLSSYAKKKS